MLSQFIEAGEAGRPVFVPDIRRALTAERATAVEAVLVLPDGAAVREFSIPLPDAGSLSEAEAGLAVAYVRAEIYNHLATLGGYSLSLYLDTSSAALVTIVNAAVAAFEIDRPRSERTAYGRIVNMLDRMNDALHPDESAESRRFVIETADISERPEPVESVEFRAQPDDTFAAVTRGLEGTMICGLDVGGTDIKGVVTVDGRLVAVKEYDWNPASYGEFERVTGPIVTIVRLLRARGALDTDAGRSHPDGAALLAEVTAALDAAASTAAMLAAAARVEDALGAEMPGYDAVGMCFPDVVVRNRIVGGEVPKTLGMRRNTERDFEEQFARLTALDRELQELCREDGVVMNTNDGPMAAFTAAVEIAASPTPEIGRNGVFAHTLGTDLGTGLALADATIPEIPLEIYNLILDLGSTPARRLPPEDLRSVANANTGIPGTPQRLASQAAAFRLADEVLGETRPELLAAFAEMGFVEEQEGPKGRLRFVPEVPVDRRKPYLAHLMSLVDSVPEVGEVFRRIGEYMAVVYRESEYILRTGLTQRFLFGRFVKVARCFDLMQEGASRREPDLEFVAADSNMAYTPLMKALDAEPDYTVAQFGQAVGAVYFGNLGLLTATGAAEA
ncbi:MAG: hypothetical protein ACOC2D_17200 [Spirochaetota bacterium]